MRVVCRGKPSTDRERGIWLRLTRQGTVACDHHCCFQHKSGRSFVDRLLLSRALIVESNFETAIAGGGRRVGCEICECVRERERVCVCVRTCVCVCACPMINGASPLERESSR